LSRPSSPHTPLAPRFPRGRRRAFVAVFGGGAAPTDLRSRDHSSAGNVMNEDRARRDPEMGPRKKGPPGVRWQGRDSPGNSSRRQDRSRRRDRPRPPPPHVPRGSADRWVRPWADESRRRRAAPSGSRRATLLWAIPSLAGTSTAGTSWAIPLSASPSATWGRDSNGGRRRLELRRRRGRRRDLLRRRIRRSGRRRPGSCGPRGDTGRGRRGGTISREGGLPILQRPSIDRFDVVIVILVPPLRRSRLGRRSVRVRGGGRRTDRDDDDAAIPSPPGSSTRRDGTPDGTNAADDPAIVVAARRATSDGSGGREVRGRRISRVGRRRRLVL
jgi:hypothetical protein